MEKISSVVKLMAKTGVFFTNADGIYMDYEKQYIDNFVSSMEHIGGVAPKLRKEVYGMLDCKHTLEEVIADTRALLEGFRVEERQAVLNAIKGFIKKTIHADRHVHPLERENYKLWKQAFGLS